MFKKSDIIINMNIYYSSRREEKYEKENIIINSNTNFTSDRM